VGGSKNNQKQTFGIGESGYPKTKRDVKESPIGPKKREKQGPKRRGIVRGQNRCKRNFQRKSVRSGDSG